MTDIFLVRHGEAAASWGQSPDPGLSELGHVQARSAAQALLQLLAGKEPVLVSSPMARTLETAVPLADELGLSVQVNEAFREIQAPVPLAERQTWLRAFMQQRWDEQPESLHTWRDRPRQELLALQTSTVIFTHFLVINAVVGQIQAVDATLCCWPDNGSITHLRSGENGLELVALGAQMKTVVN